MDRYEPRNQTISQPKNIFSSKKKFLILSPIKHTFASVRKNRKILACPEISHNYPEEKFYYRKKKFSNIELYICLEKLISDTCAKKLKRLILDVFWIRLYYFHFTKA